MKSLLLLPLLLLMSMRTFSIYFTFPATLLLLLRLYEEKNTLKVYQGAPTEGNRCLNLVQKAICILVYVVPRKNGYIKATYYVDMFVCFTNSELCMCFSLSPSRYLAPLAEPRSLYSLSKLFWKEGKPGRKGE